MSKETFDLFEFLRNLTLGGAATFTAMLASFLAENWPWFRRLLPQYKRLASIVFSGALGLGAYFALGYLETLPKETLKTIQDWLTILVLSITPILGTQVWHALVNKGLRPPDVNNRFN